MSSLKGFLPLTILALFFSSLGFSQTGPGGVGNATGANGQPQNVLWLRANSGISSSGGLVDTWTDQSGNGNSAAGTGSTRPTFNGTDANFNNLPSITFPNTASANFYLEVPDNDNLDNTTQVTAFFIIRPTSASTTLGILSKRSSASVNQSYVFSISGSTLRCLATIATGTSNNLSSANSSLNQLDIVSFVMNGTTQVGLLDGANQTSFTSSPSIPNTTSNLFIGSFDASDNSNFEGQIAEVVLYRSALNTAQRQIVENYLSSKYNSTLASGDFYAGDTGANGEHDFDLAGIGFNGGSSHLLANSAGVILSPSAGTIDTNGEFVLAGHNGVANSAVTTNLGTGGVVQRWNRTWYIDRTPATGIDANIAFDFSEGIAGQFPQVKDNYVLLFRNTGTGNFDVVAGITNADKTLIGDQISFRVANANLVDGVYTLGTLNSTASPVTGLSNRTWYSYQSGNWTNPTSWTLDGGVTPLLVNPSNETPGITDNVVITSGRTITMNTNNVQINSMEVTGTLDLLTSSGHNFVTVSGPGRIKIAGATDNLPIASYTDFADASIGGTLEINGTGIALNQARSFRNVEINLTNTANIASLEENYTINGDLRILNGLFRFNNNVAVASRTCTVNGNVIVSATGGIRTGTASARHEFNLNGDFTNDGTAFFTQRTDDSQRNAAEATDGIVDVNIVSSSRDQLIACNGLTRFYRIEIDKGTDETYKTSLVASAPANFGLFGKANYDINTATGANDNAIGLRNGTLEVGANVAIPHLNTTGNYAIFETAQLWVNGGSVTKSGGTAIVPYGRVRVSSGFLTALIGSGLTTRESGIIQVEGGTVTVGAIRTSTLGVGAVGSYIQSGGTVTVTGTGGINDDYAVFSLTYSGNVFNMSGGSLTIRNRPTDNGTGGLRGTIFINSDPANVSITGGSIVAEINSNVPYIITSRAPFWNLTMRNTLDATLRDIELLGSTSGTGGGTITLPAQNLVVKGGLTIGSFARLDHNGRNLNIAGNLTIEANGDLIYDPVLANGRRNITTFDGTDNATLTFLNRTGGTGDEQDFWSLVINKPADKVVTLASGKTNLNGTNNNLINVQGDAFKLFSGTLDQGFHSVRLFCDTILNYQTVGVYNGATTALGSVSNDANDMIRFRNNPVPTVLLTTPNAVFGAVRFNRDGAPMQLNSNLRIQLLEYLFGKWDIGTYRLTIDRMVGNNANFSEPPPGDNAAADSLGLTPPAAFGLFSVEDMIVTDGNASDGGLAIRIFANGSYRFPLGIGTSAVDNTNNPGTDKYTPALATISGFSDDGYIIINPVNQVLQTTNLSGGPNILDYYWRVRFEGFTTLPTVRYQFTYNSSDVGGSEATYLPGKVLDINPFTRSSEAGTVNTAVGKKIIHFDGTGAGFILEQANYTAGAATRFTGTPTVYYCAVGAGNWNAASTWSLTRGGAGGAGIPVAGNIVIMRRGGSGGYPRGVVTIPTGYTANAAQVLFDDEQGFVSGCPRIIFQTGTPFNSNLGTVEVAPTHQGGTLNGDLHGAVLQYNVDNTYAGAFPQGDFGGFNNYLNSLVIYEWQSGTGTITLSSNATVYPQLWFQNGATNRFIKFPNVNVTVRGRAYITGNNQVMASDGINPVTLNFQRNLEIGSSCCGGGTFFFPGSSLANQKVQVDGNIVYSTAGTRSINILNPASGTRTHTLIVKGNIDVVAGTTLNLGSGSTSETNVVLELQGTGTNTFTNAGTATLSRIVMNKGSDLTSTFTFNSGFTLTGSSATTIKPITLLNGLLVLNNSAINVTLTSGGADFSIPGTAGLEVRAGTARTSTTSTNANILLDGLLRVSGGTVDINGGGATDTNFIEYSNSGNAVIEVTSGTLTVAGKIRRALTSSTGILRYTQSGGTVLIANESGSGSDDRGVFEIVNAGSQFNHSGGGFTIVQGINSTTVPSLLLEPSSSAITSGSTITIGNASTPAGANSQNIGIKATVPLNNLTIAGANSPVAKIYVSPLTVANNLLLSSGTTLNANNQNLTIGGNFTVDGSYVPTTNTTSFTNTAAASISGATPLFNFFNFSKSGAGTLTVSKDITVNQDLSVLTGTLATSSFAINLKRNALIDATITSTSGSGLIFNGSTQQQLTRSVNGTSSLGIVTVNNSAGVLVPDGNGYTFTITGGLRLQQGVFDIGGSLLNLTTSALITPLSPFSVTNMIQTNSSFTDQGVRKQFPAGSTTDFTFPVGQLAYTPVIFNFSSPTFTTGTSATTITIRPANETHPAIINDDELPIGAGPEDFDDLQNALKYHWIINADNATGLRSIMTLQYDQSAVQVTAPRTEADYIPARILSDANPTGLINKFTTAELNETLNAITFNFSGITDAGISGQYFAGVDLAIPDNVPIYTTTASGNVSAAIYTPAVPGGGAPKGATVIVQTGHTLTLDVASGSVSLYETQINAGATLTIPNGSIGHRLGTLSGTGNLRLESNIGSVALPAAVYDDFFSCAGGGLIFAGNGSYDILGGITSLRNLTLEGIGTKSLPSNDLTICNNLTITAGGLTNTNSRTITVQNDVLLNGGTYTNIAGVLTITRDFVQAGGIFNGGTGGAKTIGRDLTVTAGTFTPGSGTSNIIRVNGNMTVAGAATISTGTGGVTGQLFRFAGSTPQTLTGDFTLTRAFNRLEIDNAAGLLVAGNTTITTQLLLTTGNISPGASTLLLGNSAIATPTEGKLTSFVNGKLFKALGAGGAPTSTNTFAFPIGKGSRWRSGSVSVASGTAATWDMEYFASNADAAETSVTNMIPIAPVVRLASGEYWKVSDGNVASTGRTATIGLSWGIESDVNTSSVERQDLRVMQWVGAPTNQWQNRGGTNFSAGNTQSRGTFNASSTISFSEQIVTLGSIDASNPLPVELIEFTGINKNGFNILKWRTASELNNNFFEVERSSNGESFEYAGTVAGNGTTEREHSYELVDEEALIGNNYYRLKQVDFDGTFTYSQVILVKNDVEGIFALSVFPNPATKGNSIKVRTQKDNLLDVTITMLDITGKSVFTYSTSKVYLENVINLPDDVKSGVYLVEMKQGGKRVVRRLVID
jgi:hypothetical protein